MFAKKAKVTHNLLELVPRRLRDYDVDDEGIVTVRVPRFKYQWMATRFLPKWKNPNILTRLDAIGSQVWLNIDGQRTVAAIAALADERFGEAMHPLHDRLSVFLHSLLRRGFISLHKPDGTQV
ncbi:MAG: PqqD family protein [Bacteroidia bacterium]|nr:PqqD family protein [Bacteroidia bacterium]